jgi:hypothetical protein
LGLAHEPGQGADPAGVWAPEDSRLVFGIGWEAAARLAVDFAQNAMVCMGADAVPKLLMLR